MSAYAGDLTPQEAWDLLASNPTAVLVDVRTDAEWRFVGVPDTSTLGKKPVLVEWQSFPGGDLNTRFAADLKAAGIAPEAPLVMICRSGQRSIAAAIEATEAGLGPCYNVLEGFEGAPDDEGHRGWEGWKAAGLPWRQ